MGARSKRATRFELVPFEEIKPDLGSAYLIKGLLQSAGLVLVRGAPKSGMSFWTSDALMHVALGREYRGHRVRSGLVVYCALEGALGFRNRIEAFQQAKLSEIVCGSPAFYLRAAPLRRRQNLHRARIVEGRRCRTAVRLTPQSRRDRHRRERRYDSVVRSRGQRVCYANTPRAEQRAPVVQTSAHRAAIILALGARLIWSANAGRSSPTARR